ncbi:MAG: hypothetical protein LBH43_01740 [Treponema sp.]|jgi:hypothetical protein|nr:hypothetical protein [Treponema sp.]
MELEDILKQIYPDEDHENCLSGVVSSIGQMLINGSDFLKIKKVTPAGSLGKKTLLKGHLEVDCVYILEHNMNVYSYDDYYWEVKRVLQETFLKGKQFVEKKMPCLSFVLEKRIGNVSVDLFPAYEINSPYQMMEVKNRKAYYGSTSLLQKKYFKNVVHNYQRFSDLVRLLKLWRNTRNIPLSSYMLELIASNAIYDTRIGEDFSFYLEVCFRTIQSFSDGRKIVPVYWEDYYDNSDLVFGYSRSDLWIMDPSDPSENIVKEKTEEEKHIINSEAIYGVSKLRSNNYSFLYQ